VRAARAIWLLASASITPACAGVHGRADDKTEVFEYRTSQGELAKFDPRALTISYDSKVLRFTDCSDENNVCLRSDSAKIVVPRDCRLPNSPDDYIRNSDDLRLIGLEGLSGNVFKAFRTGKFAYAYHPDNGIVQFILIPDSVDKSVTEDRADIPRYTYRIWKHKGPFPCK